MLQWASKGIFKNRFFRHTIFWLSIVVFFSLLWGSYHDEYYRQFLQELLYLPDKMIPTYLVLYVFMPRFFWKEKYGLFILWTIISLFAGAFLQSILAHYIAQPCFYPGEDWGPVISTYKLFKYANYIYPYVLLAFLIKFLKNWYSQQKQTQELLKGKMEAELKFLKTQLHPHFLFNTLNNLYALTLKKSDKAPELVLKLSDLMDYMLYECDADRVPLDREMQFVNNYFEIEKLRYGNRLSVDIQVEGNLVGKTIAPLIFLPFLENAFKHGISQDLENAWIKLLLKVDSTGIDLTVSNSKAPGEVLNGKNNGIGLSNVKRRLELQYGEENYELTTESDNSYFSINLKLFDE